MSNLNDRVHRIAAENARIYPNDAGLVDALDAASSFFGQMPETFRFEFHQNLTPNKIGKDPGEVFVNLLKNWHGWIGFFVYSVAYKVTHLLDDVSRGLNSSRYILVAASARGIVEQVAIFNNYFRQVSELLQDLQAADPGTDFPGYVNKVVELIKLLQKYSQATRFNWKSYAAGDLDTFFASWNQVDDSVRQTNIMTMIDKLPQEEKGAKFFYEMLCDFVHPNIGSHFLVIDTVDFVAENRAAYTLSRNPTSDELLGTVLHVISIPLKTSLQLLKSEVESLLHTITMIDDWISKCEGSPAA